MLFLLSTLLFLCVLVSAADLYKTLDLARSASEKDIRAAYKRLSRKYHPDKNKDPGAEEKFVEIAHAYEVLSDPKKKQIYDQYGEEGLKAHEGGQTPHANPFDIFQSFFGGHPGQQVRKGPTSISDFEVSLADVYTGASLDFMIKKRILCDHCRGSGAASSADIHTCPACGGAGVKIVRQQIFPGMFSQSQVSCNECGGRGKIIKRVCPHCKGSKVLDHTQHYNLEVPKGMPEGFEIVYEGEGDESPDWESGDVIMRVRTKKERGGFRRKESNLYWKETIGVDEALLGFEHTLTHLDGHKVQLKRTGVTQPGYVQTIKGKGLPIFNGNGYGDLFIEYNVVLPKSLSPEMKKRVAEAFHGNGKGSPTKDEL
ncbi:DnaJ-domain-containing protein [Panus rudis PR-1116 ss-1]|nr:DnaJ-domain-containing protein [Panus rudis PR-1116 ss-1]